MRFLHTIGTVAGGVLATDSSPNAVEPSSERVFYAPVGSRSTESGVQLAAACQTGTTVSVRLWVQERSTDHWYEVHTAATACPVDRLTLITGLVPQGAMVFCQVTANTGVEHIGIVSMSGER